MAEAAAPPPAAQPGRALRVYQLLGMLALGWLIGRLPALSDARDAEERSLAAAMQTGAAPAPGGPVAAPGPADAEAAERTARLAAEVAARVAADVADATIARLLAAGWAPRAPAASAVSGAPLGRTAPARTAAPPAPAAETVVRIVTEARPPDAETLAALGWRIPAPTERPPAGETAASAPAGAAPDARARAHATATLGYEQLRRGERRAAARSLSRALELDPGAEQAAAWAADLRRLTRRWSASAYSLSREGTADPLAASPVLGGGQAGASVLFTPDPPARRPVSALARVASAAGPDGRLDPGTAEAAIGLRWQPLAGVPVALDVERRFALGALARNAWAARISGGTGGRARAAGTPLVWDAWGEGGIVGEKRLDVYGGAQARAAAPLVSLGNLSLDAGGGVWAAGQRTGDVATGRLDIGPSARIAMRPWPFAAQLDYRVRVAGDAEPGSGLALTVSGSF